MIKEFEAFDTIETFFRYQEKIVSLFKLPKNTLLYWLGVWEPNHMVVLDGIYPLAGTDAFKCWLFAWCYADFPNKFKFKMDWDFGDPTCNRLLKKNCFFFKVLDELFYVELPESCVIDDAFLADRRLRTQNQFDAIKNSSKLTKLEDLRLELEIWDLNLDLKKKRDNMIALLKECDLW